MIKEDQDGAETIGIYKVYRVENVVDYTLDSETFDAWHVTQGQVAVSAPLFLCIDTLFHEAVSHWIFESAIYLPLFLDLKALYPEIQLHLKSPAKRYKTQFCAHFGISPTYDLPTGSTCLFPNPISAQNRRTLNVAFEPQLRRFIDGFSVIPLPPPSIDFLILPRGFAENYKGNDREVNFGDILRVAATLPNISVINADTFGTINEQIAAVRSAKTIVLCDGAAFAINAMFAKGATIHIIGNQTLSQCAAFPLAGLLFNMISAYNENMCIYSNPEYVCQIITT
jgi:hypothetical protein